LVAGTPGIDYWEAGIRADRKIAESVHFALGFAYSPNVSNTGAWSWYAAAGLAYDVPSRLLPMISVCRSPAAPAIPGSAINLPSLAALRYRLI
jgi:hypothetical protein